MSERTGESAGGCELPQRADILYFEILYGADFAESDALGIAGAEVTLHGNTLCLVEERNAERTGKYARSAPDTLAFINDYHVEVRVPVAGFRRAYFRAKWFVAILTRHREIDTVEFPFDDFDPGPTRVGRAAVED